MTTYRLTPAAQRDLSRIWGFTQERWDENRAEICISELRAAIERVAVAPDRGPACDEICEGYRRYSIGSHVLFYIERTDGLDAVRILHQRMDPSRHF